MKLLLKAEYVALFAFSIFLFSMLPYAWWWYPLLLLLPDIGMVGYAVNAKLGAITYNTAHSLALGVALFIVGSVSQIPFLTLAGVIVIGHVGMDRSLGFGLKYPDSFKHTHLGTL